MIEWILIGDDASFIATIQERFADRPFVFFSSRESIEEHTHAWVFLELDAKALVLARQAIHQGKREPHTIKFYGDVPREQIAQELRAEMKASKIGYVERSRLLTAIEESARDRDARWLWTEAEIRRQYAGQIVAVRDQVIWGNGPDLTTALAVAEAKPGCQPVEGMYLESVPEIRESIILPYPELREPQSAQIFVSISKVIKADE